MYPTFSDAPSAYPGVTAREASFWLVTFTPREMGRLAFLRWRSRANALETSAHAQPFGPPDGRSHDRRVHPAVG